MDVFHDGMLIAGCPAVVTQLEDGAAAGAEDGTTFEGFYLAAGAAVADVDMYEEGECMSTLHAAKLTCDGTVDCMGFLRDAEGCVTWIMKDSALSEYTAGRVEYPITLPTAFTTFRTLASRVKRQPMTCRA